MKPKRVSPFDIHAEVAKRDAETAASFRPTPELTGREIGCVVGGVGDTPIPVLFDPTTRTTYPVRKNQ